MNSTKYYFLFFLLSLVVSYKSLKAEEGLWLPLLLQQLNENEMRDMGMRITAEDIYSVNHSSLKDAIISFGGGCTGELVSDQGLLLTNHHCGLSNIQKHSTLEHDYLSQGFWAQSLNEELPNPGLTVTFLVRMENVTEQVLKGVSNKMNQTTRNSIITNNSKELTNKVAKETRFKATVRPFYAGNQYYMFVTETFTDVRLVGAPPSNVGNFGGDTDNWMWPRHTGDFSVFRIYADKDNKPADYSKENIPYRPAKHLVISLKGIAEGDFTFVYGFPGTTQEYLPSQAIDMVANQRNPIAIKLRQQRLDIIDQAMENDRLTRIQYTSKAKGISNAWKKMIGESRGVKRLDAVKVKQQFESEFENWTKSNAEASSKYGDLLNAFNQNYSQLIPLSNANTYLTEGLQGIELIRFANSFSNLVKQCNDKTKSDADIAKLVSQLKISASAFYKNYNVEVDKKLFCSMMNAYSRECEPAFQAEIIKKVPEKYRSNVNAWSDDVYSKSIFPDSTRLYKLLSSFTRKEYKKIIKDPAYMLADGIYAYLQNILSPQVLKITAKNDSLQRLYMAAQMEFQPGKRFYPDANSTLRVSYGQVKSYNPRDAVHYRWFTTLGGIMEKDDPEIYDYAVEPKLKELYKAKDYGVYADKDNTMHVGFIASNHTSGGNSGSPVLDADGHLIGINFDRCWEGTMSYLIYDPDQCRNISLDIRYCLFIIDKMAGAKRLIAEMEIVK